MMSFPGGISTKVILTPPAISAASSTWRPRCFAQACWARRTSSALTPSGPVQSSGPGAELRRAPMQSGQVSPPASADRHTAATASQRAVECLPPRSRILVLLLKAYGPPPDPLCAVLSRPSRTSYIPRARLGLESTASTASRHAAASALAPYATDCIQQLSRIHGRQIGQARFLV